MNEKKPSQAEGVAPDTGQAEQAPGKLPSGTEAVQTEEEKRKAEPLPKKRGHSITIAPSGPSNPNLDVFDTPPTRL